MNILSYSCNKISNLSTIKSFKPNIQQNSTRTPFFNKRQNKIFTNNDVLHLKPKTQHFNNERIRIITSAMFDSLSVSLKKAWEMLNKDAQLTVENIKAPIREVRRALLEADVSLNVVRNFVKNVEQKALGVKVISGVTPDVQFIKVVYDELRSLMGNERAYLEEPLTGPQIILMAGLQGVGKTTACAKMALHLKNQDKNVLLIGADVYRPAAIDQLKILGEKIEIEVYSDKDIKDPVEIAKNGILHAKSNNIDSIIIDTAGRLQINVDMMNELENIKSNVNPSDILLVVDAMTGQEAANLVQTFNESLELTGAVLTKMDGDSRGGAALSVYEVSKKPIKFVGMGEKMNALEPFYPDRMAGRILGMGDILTLYEKAETAIKEEEAAELTRKMLEAKFDFNDFIKQYQMISKMGNMGNLIRMMPGMPQISDKQLYAAEKQFKIYDSLIKSMTPEERANPDLLAKSPSRRRRIARGSGRTEYDVNDLFGTFTGMRSTMQNMTKMMALRQGIKLPNMPSMSNEEMLDSLVQNSMNNIPPGMARRRKRKMQMNVNN